jgi:hypothetical protein
LKSEVLGTAPDCQLPRFWGARAGRRGGERRAGISSGLVRMSVGITGTLEARWAQLEEAFRAVARPDAAPAFRAAQARRPPG